MKIAFSVFAGVPRRGWFKVPMGEAGFVRVKLYELPDEDKDRIKFTIGVAMNASEKLQEAAQARLEELRKGKPEEAAFAQLQVKEEFDAAIAKSNEQYLGALRELVAKSVTDHAAEDFTVEAPPGTPAEALLDLGLSEAEAAQAIDRGSVAVAFEGTTWEHEPTEREKRIEEDRQKRAPGTAPRDLRTRPGASARMIQLYENSLGDRRALTLLANAALKFNLESTQDGAHSADAC